MIRVHTLWGLKRSVGILLAILLVCSTSCSLAIVIWSDTKIIPHAAVLEDLRMCSPVTKLPRYNFMVWIPTMLYELLIFIMMLIKVIRPARNNRDPIVTLLVRDGVYSFLFLTLARGANIALYSLEDPSFSYCVLLLFIGTGSAIVNRMILELRTWKNTRSTPGMPMDTSLVGSSSSSDYSFNPGVPPSPQSGARSSPLRHTSFMHFSSDEELSSTDEISLDEFNPGRDEGGEEDGRSDVMYKYSGRRVWFTV